MFTGGKLVRNKIPEIIRGNGEVPITHQVTGHSLHNYFATKGHEEISEIFNASTREKQVEEFADNSQVLRDWALFMGINPEEVEECRVRKEEERGGFSQGVVLDSVESVQRGP